MINDIPRPGIIRVFPRRTSHTPIDDLAFVGPPPLPGFRPAAADEIHVSTTFTWDKELASDLMLAWAEVYPRARVRLGGPAWNDKANGYFRPGMYIREGYTFTSRGCDNCCRWCLVPIREGRLREIEDIQPGYAINDNNFLQCSQSHRQEVYSMLRKQRRAAIFVGGLQTSLLTDVIADELRGLRIGGIFLAADTEGSLKPLRRAVARLSWLRTDAERTAKRPPQRLHCYVLIGFDGESLVQAEARLRTVWEIGAMPVALLYQPTDQWLHYDADWRNLARTWQRPALMMREGVACI